MKKRVSIPAKRSKSLFTNTAKRVHPKNIKSIPLRGGTRL